MTNIKKWANNSEHRNNSPSFFVQAANPAANPAKAIQPADGAERATLAWCRHSMTTVAKMKKLSGISAYCDVPCEMNDGVATRASPPSMATLRPRKISNAENRTPAVLIVKTSPIIAGTA